jgi:hypothetical protein
MVPALWKSHARGLAGRYFSADTSIGFYALPGKWGCACQFLAKTTLRI